MVNATPKQKEYEIVKEHFIIRKLLPESIQELSGIDEAYAEDSKYELTVPNRFSKMDLFFIDLFFVPFPVNVYFFYCQILSELL